MSLEEHPGEPGAGQRLRLCEHEETAQSSLLTPPFPTLLPGTLFCSSASGPLVQGLTCDLESFRKQSLMEKYMEHWIKISEMRHTQRTYRKGVWVDFMIGFFDGGIAVSSIRGRRP